jgi:hypothetical protein
VQIGRYAAVAELGRGGQGSVYLCRAPDGRDVAVKLLKRTSSASARLRFDRERRLLATFSERDGFVPLLDSGETPEGPFFVMPLLEGGTLRARLDRGPLGVEETISLGIRLSSALALVHAQGVVHRDLKPENVLFSREGVAYVSDLGLAKHFVPDAAGLSQSMGLSKTGELRGTAGYMAPEQVRDARTAGPAADVFAVGAILYECLAGFPAFQAETLVGLLAKVELESASRVEDARASTPQWLARVVTKALARDPRERFPDAAALRDALVTRGRAGERRWRRAPVVAAALVAIAAGTIVVFGTRAPADVALEGRPAPGRSPAPPPSTPFENALALLSGKAPVTSREMPLSALLAASGDARRKLTAGVLDRAVLYSSADLAALRRVDPSSADALEALAFLGDGTEGGRAEAKRLLHRSHWSRAGDVLVSTDSVARLLSPDRGAESDRVEMSALKFVLARLPEDVAHLSLSPLEALVTTQFQREARFGALAALDDPKAGCDLEKISPRLCLTFLLGDRFSLERLGLDTSGARVERLARAVASEDPELACRGFEHVFWYAHFEKTQAPGTDMSSDIAVLSSIAAGGSGGAPRASLLVARWTRDRCLAKIVSTKSDPDPRAVRDGLGAARAAVRLAQDPRAGGFSLGFASPVLADMERLITIALETGSELEVDEVLPDLKANLPAPLISELARLHGRPLEDVLTMPRPWGDAEHAVAALAYADAGRFEEARKSASEITGRERALIRRFGRDAVKRYIEEKDRR